MSETTYNFTENAITHELTYLGSVFGTIAGADYSFTASQVDVPKVVAGYTITLNSIDPASGDPDLDYDSNADYNAYETELKRQEMQYLIDTHYPLETRLNYMNAGIFDSSDTDFDKMNTYLTSIKSEFADNGKDADFSERE